MRILYAIQGTGNGHMARACEVIPELMKYGKVDIAVSGIQTELQLPWEVKYRLYGMGFVFGKNGGVDIKTTLKKTRLFHFIREVLSIPVHDYHMVINDFEPVVAWACKLKGKKCLSLSHQSAVLHPEAPKPPRTDRLGKNILRYYAPATDSYGFHFKTIAPKISTPVIRKEIRNAKKQADGHYTVYLPSYSDEKINHVLSQIPYIKWEVFSKHSSEPKQYGNIHFQPVNKEKFTESFLSCTGILCNAGFETPAEALHMGKKLCVVPMKGQYEQKCNAAFLESMGVKVLDDFEQEREAIDKWVFYESPLSVQYPDNIAEVIEEIMFTYAPFVHSLPEIAVGNQFKL